MRRESSSARGTYIGRDPDVLSAKDARSIALLEALPMVATPLYSALCIIAAALLFYRNRLKKPLAALRGRIGQNCA